MPASYITQESSTGTLSYTQAAGFGAVWNLTSLTISFAGPSRGPNARVRVFDGSAATGTVIFQVYLDQPTGSVGFNVNITDLLPRDKVGNVGLQSTAGNAMTIVVDGFGANRCTINGRVLDGLP